MNDTSDLELAAIAATGDRDAFAALVGRHYDLVYKLAYKWCGIREDAEDITQEVLVKLARSIRAFRGESAFSTWLYRITINTAKDFHRRNSVKAAYEDGFAKELALAENNPPGSDKEGAASDAARAGRVYKAIDTLSPKLKEAVLLVLAEGLSHRDAAEILGCAETTVSWRIFQAKLKLKKLLEGKGEVE